MKRIFTFLPVVVAVVGSAGTAPAQSFDTSGNGLLKGSWFARYVASDNISQTGTVGRARSVTGTFTFDGKGNYTLAGQISDSTVNSGTSKSLSVNGTYGVSSSGLLAIVNPLDSTVTLFGGISKSGLVASSSESALVDMLVAVPMAAGASNATLQGNYWVGSLDYPGGDATKPANALFEINADGQGHLGTLSVTGHSVALANADTTQSISGATYSLNGSSGTLTFPAGQNQLISGTKQFFVSSDGNLLVGGSTSGYDILVGVRAASGTAGNSLFNGVYYTGGIDSDVSQASASNYYVDGYYGSLHATGTGTVLAHQRINPSDSPPYDYTADDEFTINSNGGVLENYAQFYVGAGGNAVILIGRSTKYSIELSVTAETMSPSGAVVLNPLGIVNGANFAPITNPIAPGEFLTLYGSGLASSTQQAQKFPLPTQLGGVSVSINGQPAPIDYVSPTFIKCIVPYAITQAYATIQVTNNGATSNAVTLYTEQSAPGVFSLGQNGIGPGAFLHAGGTAVSDSSPANIGETIESFLTGLGAVNPTVNDGAAAPSNPLSYTADQILVFVDGTQATVTYAGLAPGFAGLYQVNFVVPSTPDTGAVYVDFEDTAYGGYTSMASMTVSNKAGAIASLGAKPVSHGLRYVHRESFCQENFGVTSGTATQARCGSAGRTRMEGRNLR